MIFCSGSRWGTFPFTFPSASPFYMADSIPQSKYMNMVGLYFPRKLVFLSTPSAQCLGVLGRERRRGCREGRVVEGAEGPWGLGGSLLTEVGCGHDPPSFQSRQLFLWLDYVISFQAYVWGLFHAANNGAVLLA